MKDWKENTNYWVFRWKRNPNGSLRVKLIVQAPGDGYFLPGTVFCKTW
jgi:hypothetical protein